MWLLGMPAFFAACSATSMEDGDVARYFALAIFSAYVISSTL